MDSHTQKQLKELVGSELKKYREARGIKASLEEKHRCWRLDYADGMSFHIDIVPCIPQSSATKKHIFDSIKRFGLDRYLSKRVSDVAVAITDDRSKDYESISPDWPISNPEGYAMWFESRMQNARFETCFQIDKVPLYKRKNILQHVIQLLKRHRDCMFRSHPDCKPISIIITTIAGHAYNGQNLAEALRLALNGFEKFAESKGEFVPNPVNPEENFADRWSMHQYSDLKLKENFSLWVKSASRDFASIMQVDDADVVKEMIDEKLSVSVPDAKLKQLLNSNFKVPVPSLNIRHLSNTEVKPWCKK